MELSDDDEDFEWTSLCMCVMQEKQLRFKQSSRVHRNVNNKCQIVQLKQLKLKIKCISASRAPSVFLNTS